ncbi:MAG: hypothetical protein MET45_13260 [Nostoc sp. LLA-1]|nr:hypothetical protein [Cyanocohniella sp. LLY]
MLNDIDYHYFCIKSIAHNILIANGAVFFPGRSYPAMRLKFSQTPKNIEQGIEILGRLLKKYLTPSLRSCNFKL